MRTRSSPGARGLVAAVVAGALLVAGCNQTQRSTPRETASGDPQRGASLIADYGCGTCHAVPGVQGADGLVGPPLDHFSRRTYIAGHLPNSAENLQTWVQNPQDVDPGTAMPDLGVTADEAADITAYLYTLE
jgi:cytochrome c